MFAALTKLHKSIHSVRGLEKPLIFSKHKIIFITLFSSRYTRENVTGKRRGKQQVYLKKNMEVMKKKPPNKHSINKRINTKTRLKELERNAGPSTDEDEAQAPNKLVKILMIVKIGSLRLIKSLL